MEIWLLQHGHTNGRGPDEDPAVAALHTALGPGIAAAASILQPGPAVAPAQGPVALPGMPWHHCGASPASTGQWSDQI